MKKGLALFKQGLLFIFLRNDMQGFLIKGSNNNASPEMNSFTANLVPGSYGASCL